MGEASGTTEGVRPAAPGGSVLLASGSPDERRSLLRVLKPLGQTLVEAESAAEVQERFRQGEFAAVLIDLDLPGGGLAAAELVRRREGARRVPILLLGPAGLTAAQLEQGYSLGAVDVLVNPVPPLVLTAKVARFVELHAEKEQARRESEQFRLLLESARDHAIFLLDPAGNVATWNPGAERIKGYRADEIVGKHFSTFYPREAAERGRPAQILEAVRREGRFHDEGWRVRKDGSQFWADVVITALRDETGTLVAFSKITRDMTEHKVAEENARRLAEEAAARQAQEESARRVHEERERLRVTLASIGDGVISTDADGRVTFLNPVAASLVGWTPEEAAGRPLPEVFNIVNETTRRPAENPALRALREGTIVGLANHTILIAKDGSERPIDDAAAPIRDADGGVVGCVLVFRDNTERRESERRLQASEARKAAILGTALDCIVTIDHEGKVVDFNPAAERTFGYRRDEAIGREMGELIIPPALRDAHRGGMARYLATGHGPALNRRLELTAVRADGTEFPVELAITRIPGEGPPLFTGYLRDITERRAAEAAVQAERDRVQFVADAVPALIAYIDADAHYRLVNGAFEAWFGKPRSSMVGRHMRDVLGETAWEVVRPHVETALAGRVASFEAEVPYRGAGTRWVSATYTPDAGEDGVVQGVVAHITDITRRKRAEEALRESEQRFRGLMEQAPFSVQVFDADGRTVSVNRAWEELWGVTLDQVAEYNILEDRQLEAKGVLPLIRRAFAGEPVAIPAIAYDPNETIPERTRHQDPVRYVAAVAYPLKDEAGAVREVVLVHEDITARSRAEEALRDSEGRLRLALDAGRMGVWDWDVRTNKIAWSDNLEEIHGLAPGTFAGTFEAFQQLVHPEDRAIVGAAIQQCLEERSSYDIEFRNVWPDGSVHWMAGKGRVFTDAGGRPARMIGVALDVTDRKRAEQDSRFLADASATLAALVDYESTLQKVARLAVPHFADWCSVDMLDEKGNLRRVAVAHGDPTKVELAHELHRRFPPDPAAPTGVWNIIRTAKSELIPEITDDLLAESTPDAELLGIIRALGLRSYMGVPLTAYGKIMGVITFIAAESGRRYDAEDLAVAEDLAHRAAVAIENARLYLEVREADRKKDEFLSILAHELRNPLAPIRNALQIFKLAGADRAVTTQAREMAERQVHALTRMVDDLLDVSRIMRGKIELRTARIDLAAAVTRAVETARPVVDAEGHELSVSLPEEPVWVHGDLVRLAQVVSNLLTNAAKYSEPKGRIWLTASREGGRAVVRVRDEGIGIAPEKLRAVFDLFMQVDAAGERAQGGLGIGLTVVRNLVEMHGGTVEAHSEGLGRGSEFVVRLPLAPDRDGAAGAADADGVAVKRTPRRILVVDDNVDAAESLAILLRLEGHAVRVAHDGLSGLKLAEEDPPELAFLDVGMPRMNGHELARRFRAHPKLRGVRLVAMTGWGQPEDRRRTREAGFDRHLVKPPEPAALDDVLAELDEA